MGGSVLHPGKKTLHPGAEWRISHMYNRRLSNNEGERHLKGKFELLQTLSHLFQLFQFVKRRQIFLELNS